MVQAQARCFGTLQFGSGGRHLSLNLPEQFTLRTMLDALEAVAGSPLPAKLLATNGTLDSSLRIFVDGRESRGDLAERFGPFQKAEVAVEIYFVPMLEGGLA